MCSSVYVHVCICVCVWGGGQVGVQSYFYTVRKEGSGTCFTVLFLLSHCSVFLMVWVWTVSVEGGYCPSDDSTDSTDVG